MPSAAHFVMTFADLHHFFLIEEQPRDRFEELANQHLSEEATHWKWYLADLTNLDLDPTLRLTDALRFIWSDATKQTRLLAYQIPGVALYGAGLTEPPSFANNLGTSAASSRARYPSGPTFLAKTSPAFACK